MCIRNSNILTLSVNFQSMTLLLFPPAICLGDFGRNAAQLGFFFRHVLLLLPDDFPSRHALRHPEVLPCKEDCVLVNGPIYARHRHKRHDKLDDKKGRKRQPGDSLILGTPSSEKTQMNHVEPNGEHKIRQDGSEPQNQRQAPVGYHGDGEKDGCEEFDKRVVDFSQDVHLCNEDSPAQAPAKYQIQGVCPDAKEVEEAPAEEALLDDGHFAVATPRVFRTTEEPVWEKTRRGLGFDKDRRAHEDAVAGSSRRMAEPPVLGNAVPRMSAQNLLQNIAAPQRNSTMREDGAAVLGLKHLGQSRDLVLEILGLLNDCPARRVRPHAFNGIPNTRDVLVTGAIEPLCQYGQAGRQQDVVVYQEAVLKLLAQRHADKLGGNLAADGEPKVPHAKLVAYIGRVVQRHGRVAVGHDEDLLGAEYRQARGQCGAQRLGRLVAGDDDATLRHGRLLGFPWFLPGDLERAEELGQDIANHARGEKGDKARDVVLAYLALVPAPEPDHGAGPEGPADEDEVDERGEE